MAVEETWTVDAIQFDIGRNVISLVICDHLDWSMANEEMHARCLRDKIRTCIEYAASGELRRRIAWSRGQRIALLIVAKHAIAEHAERYYADISASLAAVGIALEVKVWPAHTRASVCDDAFS